MMLDGDLFNSIETSKSVKVKDGEGFFSALLRLDLSPKQALVIINKLRDRVELSGVKPDEKIVLRFKNSELFEVKYFKNLLQTHQLMLKRGIWVYSLIQKEPIVEHEIVKGTLRENSTLIGDLTRLGVEEGAASEVVNALMCKINFRHQARAGDNFKVLLKLLKINGEVISTRPVYINYRGELSGEFETYYYTDKSSSTYSAHYLENGQALIRSGLRYPLKKMHIRSHFGHRIHPVTGKRAFHRGVDLRGRVGDPVYSVASGKVISSGFNKYAGKTLAILHRDKTISHYYHLSKRYVKKGDWVKINQRIASVGSTGRVTGAHLHFGFQNKSGKWINPMSKRMIATPKLSGARLLEMKKQTRKIKQTLFLVENDLVNNFLLVNLNKNEDVGYLF
tara:strand:- start:1190 stop:2368 length:1179 start_codon:yes stop_codon:yes gene_type:complete